MPEKRRHVRYHVEAPVLAWSMGSTSTNASRGQCLNLSEGGAAAIIAGPWQPGQVVGLALTLPNSPWPLILEARLCHRHNLYCGFEFLAPSEEAQAQLRAAWEKPPEA